jgi:hypothetical protein
LRFGGLGIAIGSSETLSECFATISLRKIMNPTPITSEGVMPHSQLTSASTSIYTDQKHAFSGGASEMSELWDWLKKVEHNRSTMRVPGRELSDGERIEFETRLKGAALLAPAEDALLKTIDLLASLACEYCSEDRDRSIKKILKFINKHLEKQTYEKYAYSQKKPGHRHLDPLTDFEMHLAFSK